MNIARSIVLRRRALDRYLLATAVICGGLVMVIEVIGSRVIGPFYGVSLFVWTSLITVTLLALALGYALGGRLADRPHSVDTLYGLVLAAGALTAIVPLARAAVLIASAPLGLRLGALAASATLFGPALFCLGCVTPIVVRQLAADPRRLGTTVGALYAWSTLGSLAGTLATGFVLLAYLSVDQILAASGAALILIGAGYFVLARRRYWGLALLVLPIVPFFAIGPARGTMPDGTRVEVVHARDTFYGSVKVVEYRSGTRGTRELLIDGLVQGGIDPATGQSIYETTYLLQWLPYAIHPTGTRALAIGLGPGLVPAWYAARGIATEAVEIDRQVVDAAQRHFGLPADLPVHVADARRFLAVSQGRYDYVLLDVFTGDTTPAHLLSVEALRLAKARLAVGGVLAMNLMASLRTDTYMSASVVATVAAVFENVEVRPAFALDSGDGVGNVIVLAYDGPPRTPDRQRLAEAAVHPLAARAVAYGMTQRFAFPAGTPAIVLTDDYNPLDLLDVALKERVRRHLLGDTPHRILLGQADSQSREAAFSRIGIAAAPCMRAAHRTRGISLA